MLNRELMVSENHISLTSVNEVNSICANLFSLTDIDFFCYARYYPNGKMILLGSNEQFHRALLSDLSWQIVDWNTIKALVEASSPRSHLSAGNSHYSYWFTADVMPKELFAVYADRFKIKGGIEIIDRLNDCYEVFWFGSSSDNDLSGFYLNNFNLLVKFILYFREQASLLIKKSEKSKIIVFNRDSEHKKTMLELASRLPLERSRICDLYEALDTKKYQVNLAGKLLKITKREHECLLYLGLGYSQKRISGLLGISPRTIEHHLQKLKFKIGIHTKEQLLSAYQNCLIYKLKQSPYF